MGNDEVLKRLQMNRIEEIQGLLDMALANAEDEENCSKEENEMYADMKNLMESIRNYIYKEGV